MQGGRSRDSRFFLRKELIHELILFSHYLPQLLDGYCLYLYGIVLKRLNLNDDARDVLVEATRAEPCHWGAWLELSGHISERGELTTLQGPNSMEILGCFLHEISMQYINSAEVNNACYYYLKILKCG